MKNRKQFRSNRGQRLSKSKRLSGVCAEIIEQRLLLSTYTVNTTSDTTNPGPNLLTLRQAVADANAHAGPDTIAFSPTVFTTGTLHTIALTQGEITFTDTTGMTTVVGPGSDILAVSGGGLGRVFQVDSGATVVMSGLEIIGGNETAADSNGNTYGGGIYNAGTLTLSNSIVTGNDVNASGYGNTGLGQGWGGGIYSTGSLTITGSKLSSNTVINTAVDNVETGGGGDAYGGAIYCTGTLVLSEDIVSGNTVTAQNASLDDVSGGAAGGGGVYATGPVTVTSSTITGNTAQAGHAEFDYSGGPAGDASGGGLFAGGSANISNSTITDNSAVGGESGQDSGSAGGASGGGVYIGGNIAITNSTVSNNTARVIGYYQADPSFGGGIYAAGNATVTNDTIDDNALIGGPSYARAVNAPTDLKATQTDASTVLSWNSSDGPDTIFQIYQSTDGGKTYNFADYSYTTTDQFFNLEQDTHYLFKVSAGDLFSSPIPVTTPSFSVTGASTVADHSTYTLNLASTFPAAISTNLANDQYVIDWGDGTTVSPDTQDVPGNTSSVTHVFAPGVVYAFVRVSFTDGITTLVAGSLNVTVTGVGQPATPGNFSASLDSSGNADLSWTESSSDVFHFFLDESTDGGVEWSQVTSIPGADRTYIDTAVPNAPSVIYRLSANNDIGGSDSVEATVYPSNSNSSATISDNTVQVTPSLDAKSSAAPSISESDSAVTNPFSPQNWLTFSTTIPNAAGGGVYVGGILTMQQSSISGNTITSSYPAYGQYGGTCVGGGVDSIGGGTVLASTIANNSANGGQGYNDEIADYLPQQGGNAAGGGIFALASLTITNSTVAANSAAGGNGGGGPYAYKFADGGSSFGGGVAAPSLTLADCTITGNSATAGAPGQASGGYGGSEAYPGSPGTSSGGGIFSPTLTLTNSIVSADRAGGVFNDIAGIATPNSDNNLVGFGGGLLNGLNGNKIGINNPELSPLGNNGGPTHTMVPLPGSPAIDAGNNSLIPPGITTDQRGLPRIVGKAVDIGATEFQASIFGTVFTDTNGNGKQDSGELGIPGVTVYIDLTNSGSLKSGDPQSITNSSGNYSFTGLVAGTYIVRQILPTGDKQIFPTNGFGNHVTVSAGQTATNANFGDQKIPVTLASISGTVFNDANANGIQNSGELGLSGWTVFIDLTNSGTLQNGDPTTTTDSNGNFTFSNLAAGTFIIRVISPTGWSQTLPTKNFGQHITVATSQQVTKVLFGEKKT